MLLLQVLVFGNSSHSTWRNNTRHSIILMNYDKIVQVIILTRKGVGL